jgi:hypothetical protein
MNVHGFSCALSLSLSCSIGTHIEICGQQNSRIRHFNKIHSVGITLFLEGRRKDIVRLTIAFGNCIANAPKIRGCKDVSCINVGQDKFGVGAL